MWKIRMMSGTSYPVSEKVAKVAMEAMKEGGVLNLGFAMLTAKSIEAIENTEEVKRLSNPIINDEDFPGLVEGVGAKIDALNNRYPGERFEPEWKQALAYKKQIEDGEVKLLE